MKAHSVALDETANRRIPLLRYHLKSHIAEDQNNKSGHNDQQDRFNCGHQVKSLDDARWRDTSNGRTNRGLTASFPLGIAGWASSP